MQPLLLLILLLFTFPPGNQRFSSFLQNDNWNKSLGSQVPRSSWGPGARVVCCPSGVLFLSTSALGAKFLSQHTLPTTQKLASPEKYEALHRKLGRRGQQEVAGEGPSGFVLLLWAHVSPQLTRAFTVGQGQKTVSTAFSPGQI